MYQHAGLAVSEESLHSVGLRIDALPSENFTEWTLLALIQLVGLSDPGETRLTDWLTKMWRAQLVLG